MASRRPEVPERDASCGTPYARPSRQPSACRRRRPDSAGHKGAALQASAGSTCIGEELCSRTEDSMADRGADSSQLCGILGGRSEHAWKKHANGTGSGIRRRPVIPDCMRNPGAGAKQVLRLTPPSTRDEAQERREKKTSGDVAWSFSDLSLEQCPNPFKGVRGVLPPKLL